MPHVLIGGDDKGRARLRSLFTQWGLTVGDLAPARLVAGIPTVSECDAVVVVGLDAELREACLGVQPDGVGAAASTAAPLLIVGPDRQFAGPWIHVSVIDPDGGQLRRALAAALDRARELRCGVPVGLTLDEVEIRYELGHELRSPLTAIKMALEALDDGRFRDSDPHPGGDTSEKMLEIALRNVQRLHRAVEWSHDVLTAADAVPDRDADGGRTASGESLAPSPDLRCASVA